ncbi:hypothetical protein Ciccas_001356 [Cichlidogyrus casuarinus]|uniref:Uncharacterized protein n=1 Tax=Cichlidogyrus casuarinus TaxID=1844966 RepID=A0ABD2QKB3_9PLAT
MERDALKVQAQATTNDMKSLQTKLNQAQREIEELKTVGHKNSPPQVDPVIVETLQSEIGRLARELTIFRQRNEKRAEERKISGADVKKEVAKDSERVKKLSMDLEYTVAKLKEMEETASITKEQLHARENDLKNSQAKVQQLESKSNSGSSVEDLKKEIIDWSERLKASDDISKYNYSRMEGYKKELEQKKTELVKRNESFSALELLNKKLKADLDNLKSETNAQNNKHFDYKSGLEQELARVKARNEEFTQEKLKLDAELKQLRESKKTLLPRLEALVGKMEEVRANNNNGTVNGYVEEVKVSRSRMASNDQLVDLTLENNHYKELLQQTEATLSALQSSVLHEQTVWKDRISSEQKHKLQLEAKIARLEQELSRQECSKVDQRAANGAANDESQLPTKYEELTAKNCSLMEQINKLQVNLKIERENSECEKKTAEELRSKIRQMTHN